MQNRLEAFTAAATVVDAEVAARFVTARRQGRALSDYPGPLPRNLAEGYRRQDGAIALFDERIVGWKVGYIAPARRDSSGDERLLGPIFESALWPAGEDVAVPVFAGGFAAVEAEFVFRLGSDAPAQHMRWTRDDAERIVATMHLGVELAGSPLASINELGPAVVVSDFGNNAGLILGPSVSNWRERCDALTCATFIDGKCVGRGGAATLQGGPLQALAFALSRNAQRGRPLRAGDLITTGAATGIHDILPGQRASVLFDDLAEIRCHAVARPVTV